MNWGRRVFVIVLLTLVYVATGRLGLRLAFLQESATAVWPPTGIALGAMLMLGTWVWPSVLAGAFVVNLITAGTVWTSLGIATGNTLEAVTGSLLVSRFAGGRDAFFRPLDVFRFALLSAVSTMISASIGVTVLCLGHLAAWNAVGPIWLTWWLGDAVGAVLFAPLLVLWCRRENINWRRTGEAILLIAGLLGLGMLAFGSWTPWQRTNYPLEFIVTPVLLWAAFRFGPRGATASSLVLASVALRSTLHGFGPFVATSPNESLLLLQAYLGVGAVMVLAVSAVVWEREQARRQLANQTQELERSNADLQHFAYVASHDLKEPLRMTGSFAELLARRYRGQLSQEADEFIDYITSGVRRMSALIDGLLLYSRAGDVPLSGPNTDGTRALEVALLNLAAAIQESDAVVTHDPLPVLAMNESQLVMIFQNLVGNSIKYRNNQPPRVHVSATQEGGEWILSVKDNGIGIEPEYRDHVFTLFKRLHGPQVPGAGIGLALCKRIVERHGGRIWIESPPEPGTCLRFALPKDTSAARP